MKPSIKKINKLQDLPNVGPAIAARLRALGIDKPSDLPGRDPYAMYDELNSRTGQRHDLCLLDVFISVVRFMNGAPARPWGNILLSASKGSGLQQLADLFVHDKSVISRHLKNIFESGELDRDRTVAKKATVQMEGEREVIRQPSVPMKVNTNQAKMQYISSVRSQNKIILVKEMS